MALIRRFFSDTRGATAIEYAMIAALVSVAIVAGARAIGVSITNRFVAVSNNLS
jgi:pilus assembly protein Flp/PilA